MAIAQDFVPVRDITEGVAILENGDLVMVLETSAVNFGLLSANEQIAIISAFAGMLNSLSFSIQIVIRSKRLDISDYLKVLDSAYQQQTNPLLANMMIRYRKFIESIVRDNEVLDKQFFVVIGVSYLEIGFTKSSTPDMKKALTLLVPRRDHIMRQLSRIGLKATPLNNKQLVELFYDIYNFDPGAPPKVVEPPTEVEKQPEIQVPTVEPIDIKAVASTQERVMLQTTLSKPVLDSTSSPQVDSTSSPQVDAAPTNNSGVLPNTVNAGAGTGRVNTPYVVEELKDDFDSPQAGGGAN